MLPIIAQCSRPPGQPSIVHSHLLLLLHIFITFSVDTYLKTHLSIPKFVNRLYRPRISVYFSPEPGPTTAIHMAQPEPTSGSLPVFYGEQLDDGNTVERPKEKESQDQLVRYPINQPGPAHLNPEMASAAGPSLSTEPALGFNTPSRVPSKRATYVNYSDRRRSEDNHRSPRFDPYYPEYRERREREPYVEDYYDDEDRPRPYRRPRRGPTRPPLSHENYHNRQTRGPMRGSYEDRRSVDYYEEPDTPMKPRVHYHYGSDEEEPIRYGHYGDGGRRGPPRRPASTEEVMRLPWTMWMNSNAKNRRFPELHSQPPIPPPSQVSSPASILFCILESCDPGPSFLPPQPGILTLS